LTEPSEGNRDVEEARLEQLDAGLTPVTDGWFVVNVRDAAWVTNEALGAACIFEGDVFFPQLGYTIAVLQPGQSGGRYHREANQEDFLVLAGECLLLIEGEERPLKAWDFVHCPPDTEHAFVGAGDGPCVIFMTGSREGWPENKGVVYPRSELALRHGAGVETETTVSAEAYAPFPKWQPGPPDSWTGLPWA
jgi:quercetin dioxygenase-like cupin family protein